MFLSSFPSLGLSVVYNKMPARRNEICRQNVNIQPRDEAGRVAAFYAMLQSKENTYVSCFFCCCVFIPAQKIHIPGC